MWPFFFNTTTRGRNAHGSEPTVRFVYFVPHYPAGAQPAAKPQTPNAPTLMKTQTFNKKKTILRIQLHYF